MHLLSPLPQVSWRPEAAGRARREYSAGLPAHLLAPKGASDRTLPTHTPCWGTACSCHWRVWSPQKLLCIFLEDLQQSLFYFLLSGEWLCERMQFSCFQRQDSLWQRNVMLWRSGNRLSHTLCSLSLSFYVYLPLRNSQILDSLVPVSVSRTFVFSRGDSLAGSPGKHAWGLDLHRSMGFARGLWSLSLSHMKTSLSQLVSPRTKAQHVARLTLTCTHWPGIAGSMVSRVNLAPKDISVYVDGEMVGWGMVWIFPYHLSDCRMEG